MITNFIFNTLTIQVLDILMPKCIVYVFWISTLQSNKTFQEFLYVWTNLLHKSEIRIFFWISYTMICKPNIQLGFLLSMHFVRYTSFIWISMCVCIIVVCHSDPYIHKEKHYPTSTTTFLACVRGKLWQW